MDNLEKPHYNGRVSKIYVAKYRGHTASVYEQDGGWQVDTVVMPDDGRQEKAMGNFLTDPPTPIFEGKSFDSLEKAQSAAHTQLEGVVGEMFDVEWQKKC